MYRFRPPCASAAFRHRLRPRCSSGFAAVQEIEVGVDRRRALVEQAKRRGDRRWRLVGTSNVARSTCMAPGRIRVRIDRQLMPGSNTPRPPASRIQFCPGCHTRMSSFQVARTPGCVATRATRAPARRPQLHASARKRKEMPACLARCSRSSTSATVAPGGFSSMTCRPASIAVHASSCRPCGGVHSDTASSALAKRAGHRDRQRSRCRQLLRAGSRRLSARSSYSPAARASAGRGQSCRCRRARGGSDECLPPLVSSPITTPDDCRCRSGHLYDI